MKNTIYKFYKLLAGDSLYKNSIYLMLNTGIMAVFGFLFWTINARLYPAEQVGLGTTLISVMTLLSSFSILGLGDGLIRYLPISEFKNKKINTSFTIVALISILTSVIYLIFLKTFSPKLLFVKENITFSLLFVLFIAFSALNEISEYTFIAYRSSKFLLIKNTIYSIIKLILPILLVALGAYGIFMSVAIAATVGFSLSLVLLIFRFNYLPKPIIDKSVVKLMTKFSLGNYASGFIVGVPSMVLPIFITNLIGAKFSAYFYMDMMIVSLLFIIPLATSRSLFAEGSHDETELKVHLKKVTKIISIIMIPSIIVIFLFGNYILLAFGKEYSLEGFTLLKLLSISGIFYSVNVIGGTILKIRYKIKLMILLSFITASVILSLSIILLKMNLFGVVGVGISWIVGQGFTTLIYLFLLKKQIQ